MAAGASGQQTGNPDGSPESFSGLSGGAVKTEEAPKMKTEHKILFAVIAAVVVVALILLLYFTSPNRALPFRCGLLRLGRLLWHVITVMTVVTVTAGTIDGKCCRHATPDVTRICRK